MEVRRREGEREVREEKRGNCRDGQGKCGEWEMYNYVWRGRGRGIY